MRRRPPRSTPLYSSAASDVYKRQAEDSFYLVSAGANLRLDHDWIKKWMPDDGVTFEDLTNSPGVLSLAGPKSSDSSQQVSTDDFSTETFTWLTAPHVTVSYPPVRAQ